ncbi:MAG: hypothetical protein ACLUEQ_09610 [Cloacibacillus evryensis]
MNKVFKPRSKSYQMEESASPCRTRLGGDRELFYEAQMGTIDGLACEFRSCRFDKKVQVLDLPYLYQQKIGV